MKCHITCLTIRQHCVLACSAPNTRFNISFSSKTRSSSLLPSLSCEIAEGGLQYLRAALRPSQGVVTKITSSDDDQSQVFEFLFLKQLRRRQ